MPYLANAIQTLKTKGIAALEAIAVDNCPILAQAQWFEENDPAKLSTLWSVNYRAFISIWLYRWNGEGERKKVPIFIDHLHVWQWEKAKMRGKTKLSTKLTFGWL